MRRLIIFLLAVVGGHGEEEKDVGSVEFKNTISVDCYEDRMSIRVDYERNRIRTYVTSSLAKQLEHGTVNLNDKCSFSKDLSSQTHQLMNISYRDCGLEKMEGDHATRYRGRVFVYTGREQEKNEYIVSCSILKNMNKALSIQLFAKGPNYNNGIFYHTVLNEGLYITVQPVTSRETNFYVPRIYSYPESYSLIDNRDQERIPFILKGCPVYNFQRKIYLSSVLQQNAQMDHAESTDVYVVLNEHLLPKETESGFADMELQCRVFYCSSEKKNRILGLPLCPSIVPCNSKTGQQAILSEVGGRRPEIVTTHLPLPLRIDLRQMANNTPLLEPISKNAPINVSSYYPEVRTVYSTSSFLPYIVTGVIGIMLGFLLGVLALYRFRGDCYNGSRCGSAVSQANPAAQSYQKLGMSTPVGGSPIE